MFVRHPKTPFITLSARKQRDFFIRTRWRILRDAPVYGGKFTSPLRLPSDDECAQWFDFFFLGGDERTVWHACIVTVGEAINSGDQHVHECYRINRSFSLGIGLDIVINEHRIDKTTIERSIQHWDKIGNNWVNYTLVSMAEVLKSGMNH